MVWRGRGGAERGGVNIEALEEDFGDVFCVWIRDDARDFAALLGVVRWSDGARLDCVEDPTILVGSRVQLFPGMGLGECG